MSFLLWYYSGYGLLNISGLSSSWTCLPWLEYTLRAPYLCHNPEFTWCLLASPLLLFPYMISWLLTIRISHGWGELLLFEPTVVLLVFPGSIAPGSKWISQYTGFCPIENERRGEGDGEKVRAPATERTLQTAWASITILPILGFNQSHSRGKEVCGLVPSECYAGSSMVNINFSECNSSLKNCS